MHIEIQNVFAMPVCMLTLWYVHSPLWAAGGISNGQRRDEELGIEPEESNQDYTALADSQIEICNHSIADMYFAAMLKMYTHGLSLAEFNYIWLTVRTGVPSSARGPTIKTHKLPTSASRH